MACFALRLLGHRHLLEILGAEHLIGRGGEGGIDFDVFLLLALAR